MDSEWSKSRVNGQQKHMALVLIGPPQSGKTTQGERLFASMGFRQVIFNDVLREAVASGSQEGQAIQEALLSATQPDVDRLMAALVASKVSEPEHKRGFTLEGFPSTLKQAICLDEALSRVGQTVNLAILLDVNNPDFNSKADQVLSFYKDHSILHKVDGNIFVEDVERDILKIIKQYTFRNSAVPGTEGAPLTVAQDDLVKGIRWIDPRRSDRLKLAASTAETPATEFAKQFISNVRFREDMHKHDRTKYAPNQKYTEAITSSMDYGWKVANPELYVKDPELFHPRMKSRETAYAEALILGPRHC